MEQDPLMPYSWVRSVLWWWATLTFRIRITGAENIPTSGSALLVSNHISYADAVLAGYTTPRAVRFLMWQPIYDVPVANYFFRVLHAIPIDATSPKGIIRALRLARAELKQGELVAIFAEGAISRSGEIQPFERGFEKVLDGSDAPVIPMHIEGLYGHPLSCANDGPFKSWKKLWRPVVNIRIGTAIRQPLSPEELRAAVQALAPHERLNQGRTS
jgi:acyl-[acyl-carrier-protein]-phospholipid O-acyltransferase/long-chain-fatty-acid--[acyl-carrier-protein] ligase